MTGTKNIERVAGRLLAIYGWQPLGVLGAVLLGFALVADHFYSEYEGVSQNIAALEKKSREMARKVGQQKQMEATLKEKRGMLARQRDKGFFAATPELAGVHLVDEIQRLAAVSQAKPASVNALAPHVEDGVARLRAEGELSAQTRQLVALLEGMANSPKTLRVETLKVAVQDPAQPAMLTVKLAVEGFYVAPQVGGKSVR